MGVLKSGAISATAAAGTTLVYSGPVIAEALSVFLTTVTGATTVTFSVYDNNVASSATTAAGATWTGISPGYSGRGPGTSRYVSQDLQSARVGNQQGQTSPNGAGVVQYWPVNTTTGDLNLAAAPTTKTTATISGDGTGSFPEINNTSETGNVVAANTTARLVATVSLTAGQSYVFPFVDPAGFSNGIDIVVTAAGATVITGGYNMTYDALP